MTSNCSVLIRKKASSPVCATTASYRSSSRPSFRALATLTSSSTTRTRMRYESYSPRLRGGECQSFHHHRPDLRRLRCVGPGNHDIVSGTHHSRKHARAESGRTRHIHRGGSGPVRRNLAHTNLGSLTCSFDPTDNRSTGRTAHDVHTAEGISISDSDFFSESLSGVRRHQPLHFRLSSSGTVNQRHATFPPFPGTEGPMNRQPSNS